MISTYASPECQVSLFSTSIGKETHPFVKVVTDLVAAVTPRGYSPSAGRITATGHTA